MAITAAAGYKIDPTNPNGVVPIDQAPAAAPIVQSPSTTYNAATNPTGTSAPANYVNPNAQNIPSYTPPSSISSANLQGGTTTTYTQPAPDTTYTPSTNVDTTVPTPTAPILGTTETKLQKNIRQLMDTNTSLQGETAYKQEQAQTAGMPALLDTKNSISKQILALQAEAKNIPDVQQQDILNRGITTKAGLAPLTTAALRNNSIQANILGAQLAASQLDIASAQTMIDKAVAMKFGPIEEAQKAQMANLELLAKDPSITAEQQQRAQSLLDAQKAKDAQIAKDKQNFADVQKIGVDAAANISTFVATPQYPTAAQALQAIQKATNPVDAQAIASSVGLIKPTNVTPKILGSASTGYYTYDAKTGKTTPLNGGSTTPAGNSNTVTTVGGNGVLVGGVKVDSTVANDVQAVLEGRNTLLNIRQTMGKTNAAQTYMQKMRDAITRIDSNFDFVASDAGGKSVGTAYVQRATAAINSVLPNIDHIISLSNNVSRFGVKGVDSVLQKTATQFGDQKVSSFHEAQKLIADEIGVALGAGTVSDMKLQLGFDVTDPSVSQEVFASNMGIVKQFIQNRLTGLQSLRYKSSTLTPDNQTNSDLTTTFDNLFNQYGGQ